MTTKGHRNRVLGLVFSTIFFVAAIAGYHTLRKYGEAPADGFLNSSENGLMENKKPQPVDTLSEETLKKLLEEVDANGLSKATVVITTARGKIKFKFYTQDAPRTVARVAHLITTGFYNGLIFHRVEPQFVVQGGDPTGTGTGGSGLKLPAEFNSRKHIAGTVGMARAQNDIHSADSQFYISLGTHHFLDDRYTIIGLVIEGLEVANQLRVGDRMTAVTIE